jgi:hypothetical protein
MNEIEKKYLRKKNIRRCVWEMANSYLQTRKYL